MVETVVGRALQSVLQRVSSAAQSAGRTQHKVTLVAVSKTKPIESVQEAYDAGHRIFGENYVQELCDKVSQLPSDIEWHFIGHLQSNKAKVLVQSCPNLAMLETIDSEKLANKVDAAVEVAGRSPLPILIQVNTSGEESKHGVAPEDTVTLAQHIATACKNLKLAGLMTIGQPDYSSKPENFTCLTACRAQVAEALSVSEDSMHLSMGMSGDFEQAVGMGSTVIRVGSTIFGARDYSK